MANRNATYDLTNAESGEKEYKDLTFKQACKICKVKRFPPNVSTRNLNGYYVKKNVLSTETDWERDELMKRYIKAANYLREHGITNPDYKR